MMRTTAALLERALQTVDVVGGGQTPSAEDSQLALSTLLALNEELSKRGILYLAIDRDDMQAEAIPEELFLPLADILAFDLQTPFKGGVVDGAMREIVINRLRRVTYRGPSYDVLKAEYF